MKQCDLSRELLSVDCPDIHTPEFSRCLKTLIKKQPKSKRERLLNLIESGCETLVTHRVIVSGMGVSLSAALVFGAVFNPFFSSEIVQTNVQASEVIEEVELASTNLDHQQRRILENRLNVSFEELIQEAKTARASMVFEVSPHQPIQVLDQSSSQPQTIRFIKDPHGRLLATQRTHPFSWESTFSAETKYRLLEYKRQDQDLVFVELNEHNSPQSRVVLTNN